MSDPVQDYLNNSGGNGGAIVKFVTVGDKIAGTITGRRVKDMKAIDEGKPPVPTLIIDVTDDEGAEHALFVKPGQMTAALGKAVKEAGRETIVIGDRIGVQFTGTESVPGKPSPKKLFAVAYKAGAQTPVPPAAAVNVSDLI